MLTGGGSGGHVTPLLAVADELKIQQPEVRLSYAGERGSSFGRLMEESPLISKSIYVSAGKLRVYHDESFMQRLLDIKTNALNVRDAFKVIIGIVEASVQLARLRPDVVFIKGGFVGVPIGLAAAMLRIPFITHDSDVVPGRANRIIARWARKHATGMPESFYAYPKSKTVCVGVPVSNKYVPSAPALVKAAKKKLGIKPTQKVVMVTGGSQGSQRINEMIKVTIEQLLADESVTMIHHVGHGNEDLYETFSDERLIVAPFFDNFSEVVMASDVIVTRAGATSMAEFGIVGKSTIVIPSPFLAGGHQLANARELAKANATIIVDESAAMDHPLQLLDAIHKVLYNKTYANKIAKNLQNITKSHAAADIAKLLLNTN